MTGHIPRTGAKLTQKMRKTMRRAETARRQDWEAVETASPAYAQRKKSLSVKVARECSRNSWQSPADRAEYMRLKRAAMLDARAWAAQGYTARSRGRAAGAVEIYSRRSIMLALKAGQSTVFVGKVGQTKQTLAASVNSCFRGGENMTGHSLSMRAAWLVFDDGTTLPALQVTRGAS